MSAKRLEESIKYPGISLRLEDGSWNPIYLRACGKKYRVTHKAKADAHNKKKRESNRAQWQSYLIERGWNRCSLCGYDKNSAAIEFHHRNPEDKTYLPASMLNQTVTTERILELEKCVVLCANCHRELHHPACNSLGKKTI